MMGSNDDRILDFMKSMNRPVTSTEIINILWPDIEYSSYCWKRVYVHKKLVKLEKYGIVKKGAMLNKERLWVIM